MRISFIFFVAVVGFAAETHKAVLEPIDVFYNGARVKIQHIGQLASEEDFMYLRTTMAPVILVLGHSGVVKGGIGGPGKPGFENGGSMSMAVVGSECWSLDNRRQLVHHFIRGQLERSFPLKVGDMPMSHVGPSNSFASDGRHLIFAAPEGSGALGVVYSGQGSRLRTIGEALDLGDALAETVPAINEVLWFFHGETFYGVHKYFPMVSMYDRSLSPKGQFQFNSDLLESKLNALHQFQSTKWMTLPAPLITDAAIHEGSLYVMSGGLLHKIGLKSQQLEATITFHAPDGIEIEEGAGMDLHYFTFFGRFIYLAHPAVLWNHDLWRAPISSFHRSS